MSEENGGANQGEGQKTFTQDDVNRIVAEEKAKAKRAAARDSAESVKATLGDLSLEDAGKLLGELEELKKSQMSEAEKAMAAAMEAQAKADATAAQAALVLQRDEVRTALFAAGTTSDDAMVLVQAAMGADSSLTAVDAVEAVKQRVPALFTTGGSQNQGTRTPPPAGRPGAERGAGEPSPEKRAASLTERFLSSRGGVDRSARRGDTNS